MNDVRADTRVSTENLLGDPEDAHREAGLGVTVPLVKGVADGGVPGERSVLVDVGNWRSVENVQGA